MKCELRNFAIFLVLLATFGLTGCAGSGGNIIPVSTISAAEVQSLAADAGYLAYEFTPSANVVQPVLGLVCSIDTTQDPVLVASELQKILGQVWSGINGVNTPEGTIIVLLINNLVTQLGLNTDLTSSLSNVSPYVISACVGVCQGIQAAENGTMPKGVKAELAAQGKLPIPMGLPPSLVVQGNYTPANVGLWSKIKKALGQ